MAHMSHSEHIALIDKPADYANFLNTGLRILAPSGVYHPHDSSSTLLMLQAVKPIINGKTVLEIGGGSGALALMMKLLGACRVTVTDICERSVATMECNALINQIKLDVRQGHLFEPIGRTRFEVVVFNMPLLNAPIHGHAERALCDPGGLILQEFLASLPDHLTGDGAAFFAHSSISAPLPISSAGCLTIASEHMREGGRSFRIMKWENQPTVTSHGRAANLQTKPKGKENSCAR